VTLAEARPSPQEVLGDTKETIAVNQKIDQWGPL